MFDLYTRSAIGETLAMIFIPMTLINLWLTLHGATKNWIFVVIGFTGILQSHIISSLILIVTSVIMILFFYKNNFKIIAKIFVFIALLNAWFYVPFIDFYNQINFHMQTNTNNLHSMSIESFNIDNFVSLQFLCGFVSIFITIAFILYRIYMKKLFDKDFTIALMIYLLSLIAATKLFPWSLIESSEIFGKAFGVLQFPYRFITFTSLAFTFCLLKILIYVYERHIKSIWFIPVCCGMITISNLLFVYPLNDYNPSNVPIYHIPYNWSAKFYKYHYKESAKLGYKDYLYADIDYSDFIYISSTSDFEIGESKMKFDDIQPKVNDFQKKGMTINFTAQVDKPTRFLLPLFYYPGYEAHSSDGTKLLVSESDNLHRMQIDVLTGKTYVTVEYIGKTLWRIVDWISAVSLFLFIFQIYREAV